MKKLRVLLANQPLSYREAIACALQELRPEAEVTAVEPEALDSKVAKLAPHLVICSRATAVVREVALSWVELYTEHGRLSEVSVAGERSTVGGIDLVDLVSIVDRTRSLVDVEHASNGARVPVPAARR